MIVNDTNWTPEDNDRHYFTVFLFIHSSLTLRKLKICFGGAYFKNLISYDQSAFSAYIGTYNKKF